MHQGKYKHLVPYYNIQYMLDNFINYTALSKVSCTVPCIQHSNVQMRMMMLFIVIVLSCVMMKIVFCSALSHEVLNSQHYKHSQSTEACADDAKKA